MAADETNAEAEPKKPKDLPIPIRLLYPAQQLPILHVNVFRVSNLGPEVFLDAGVINDQAIAVQEAALARGEQPKPVNGYIQRRLGMSLEAFLLLKENVDSLWQKLERAGVLPKPGSQE